MFKFKKIIASVCGLAMLASTFVIANATAGADVSLTSGTTAPADGYTYMNIDIANFGDNSNSGTIYVLIPKNVVTEVGDNTTAGDGLYYKSGPKKIAPTTTFNVATKSANGITFDDENYDLMAFVYASTTALTTTTGHAFEIYMTAPAKDLEMKIASFSYVNINGTDIDVTPNATTYVLKAGTSTIVEKSDGPTVTTPDEPQTATKLNLDANQYTGDNATIADAFYYDAVTDEAGSKFDKVRWTVTAPSGDNPVRYIDASITPVSGGGTVRYGLAVQGAPAGSTAKATFSVSAN